MMIPGDESDGAATIICFDIPALSQPGAATIPCSKA